MLTYLAELVLVIIFGAADNKFSAPKTHFKTLTPSVEITPKTPKMLPMMKVKTMIIIIIIQKK